MTKLNAPPDRNQGIEVSTARNFADQEDKGIEYIRLPNRFTIQYPSILSTMKKISLYLFMLATPFTILSQNCAEMYDYYKEGVLMEYTSYDKKGKVESVNTHKVTRIDKSADTLIATIAVTSVNEKGKELFQNTFPMKCHAGTVYMDLRSIIPPQQNTGQSADMQLEISGTDMTFPANMKPGQTLPDAEMGLIMRMGSLQLLNTRYFVKNRKVEAEETVTTTAGTFKCLKISYDFEYKLLGTRTIRTLYWYSTAVGLVRSVTFDKKGNEDGRMELTKLVK
jgi:hypothetical protein